MKKNRLIFYAVFAAFHICSFLFTAMLDHNSNLLFGMVKYVPYFKYVTLIGVILIIIDFVWSWKVDKDTQKAQALLNKEFNILKAKLFDLQEAAKK